MASLRFTVSRPETSKVCASRAPAARDKKRIWAAIVIVAIKYKIFQIKASGACSRYLSFFEKRNFANPCFYRFVADNYGDLRSRNRLCARHVSHSYRLAEARRLR